MSDNSIEDTQLEIWHSFYQMPGNEFEFRLARTADSLARDGADKTFSEAAMDALMQHLMVYIGTRLTRYYEGHHSTMPQALTVRIKVVTDGQIPEWSEDADFTITAEDKLERTMPKEVVVNLDDSDLDKLDVLNLDIHQPKKENE